MDERKNRPLIQVLQVLLFHFDRSRISRPATINTPFRSDGWSQYF